MSTNTDNHIEQSQTFTFPLEEYEEQQQQYDAVEENVGMKIAQLNMIQQQFQQQQQQFDMEIHQQLKLQQHHSLQVSEINYMSSIGERHKGRVLGAKNYKEPENVIILEAVVLRKAHLLLHDDQVWKVVANDVSKAMSYERTYDQLLEHFKKMLNAIQSAMKDLFNKVQLSWPVKNITITETIVNGDEHLEAQRILYVRHLLSIMTSKSNHAKYYSRNWWSENVLMRLLHILFVPEIRLNNDLSSGRGIGITNNNEHSQSDIDSSSENEPFTKRSRNGEILNDSNENNHLISQGNNRMAFEETISYTKRFVESLAQTLEISIGNEKRLEERVKLLEDEVIQLKQDLHDAITIIRSFASEID